MRRKSYILGLFAGDGWFETKGIRIATNSKVFAQKIATIIEAEYTKPIVKLRKYKDGHKLYIVSLWKKQIRDDFSSLLKTEKNKSKTFKPPELAAENKRAFIAGLFDAEASAYIWQNKPRVGLGIYNEYAAIYISKALRNDGIKCYLSRCKTGEYKIDFTGKEYVEKFFLLYPVLRLTFPQMGKSQP